MGVRQAARAVARMVNASEGAAAGPARAGANRAVSAGGLRRGAGGFVKGVLRPARRAGSVLWLEVTGFLFGLIAALAALGVWAGRAHLRPGPGQAHELAGVAMLLVFTWFAVSNFLRASRRSRLP